MRGTLAALMILGAGAATVSGCSTTAPNVTYGNTLRERLANRGPVPLSPDNPYIAANQLLSFQIQQSPEIAGFVKHRGAPPAIEIEEHSFDPLLLRYYYPANHEYFELEQEGGTWIISGPFRIDDQVFTQLTSELGGQLGSTPPVDVPHANETVIKSPIVPETAPTPITTPEEEPTRYPVSTPKPREFKPPTPTPQPEATETPEATATLNVPEGGFRSPALPTAAAEATKAPTLGSLLPKESAPEAELPGSAKGHPAEITPKGDLVHYVTMPGESLSSIARWYTHDRENADRIGRLNKIKDSNSLNIGDVIVIPNYLLKNTNRLTEDGLENLKKIGEQEKQR